MIGKSLKILLSVIGIAIAASSLGSLCQRLFGLEIAPVFLKVVEAYRSLIPPLVESLPRLVGLSPPAWYVDFATVSLIGSSFMMSAIATHEVEAHGQNVALIWIGRTLFTFLYGYSLVGIILTLSSVHAGFHSRADQSKELTAQSMFAVRRTNLFLWTTIFVTAIFFAVNAIALMEQ